MSDRTKPDPEQLIQSVEDSIAASRLEEGARKAQELIKLSTLKGSGNALNPDLAWGWIFLGTCSLRLAKQKIEQEEVGDSTIKLLQLAARCKLKILKGLDADRPSLSDDHLSASWMFFCDLLLVIEDQKQLSDCIKDVLSPERIEGKELTLHLSIKHLLSVLPFTHPRYFEFGSILAEKLEESIDGCYQENEQTLEFISLLKCLLCSIEDGEKALECAERLIKAQTALTEGDNLVEKYQKLRQLFNWMFADQPDAATRNQPLNSSSRLLLLRVFEDQFLPRLYGELSGNGGVELKEKAITDLLSLAVSIPTHPVSLEILIELYQSVRVEQVDEESHFWPCSNDPRQTLSFQQKYHLSSSESIPTFSKCVSKLIHQFPTRALSQFFINSRLYDLNSFFKLRSSSSSSASSSGRAIEKSDAILPVLLKISLHNLQLYSDESVAKFHGVFVQQAITFAKKKEKTAAGRGFFLDGWMWSLTRLVQRGEGKLSCETVRKMKKCDCSPQLAFWSDGESRRQKDISLLILEAQSLSLEGSFEASLVLWKKIQKLDADRKEATQGLVAIYMALSDYGNALSSLGKLLSKDPDYSWALARKAWIEFFFASKESHAIDPDLFSATAHQSLLVLEKALALDPYNSLYLHWLARIEWETENRPAAYQHFLQSAKFNSSFALNFAYIGMYLDQQEPGSERALKCYQKALSIDPYLIEAGVPLVAMLFKANNIDAATKILMNATKIATANTEWAWTRRAWMELKTELYQDAISSFQTSLRMNGNQYQNWEGLGFCYEKLSRFKASLKAWTRALELCPNDSLNSRLHITMINEQLGDVFIAESSYRELLKDPKALCDKSVELICWKGLANTCHLRCKSLANEEGAFHQAAVVLVEGIEAAVKAISLGNSVLASWKLLSQLANLAASIPQPLLPPLPDNVKWISPLLEAIPAIVENQMIDQSQKLAHQEHGMSQLPFLLLSYKALLKLTDLCNRLDGQMQHVCASQMYDLGIAAKTIHDLLVPGHLSLADQWVTTAKGHLNEALRKYPAELDHWRALAAVEENPKKAFHLLTTAIKLASHSSERDADQAKLWIDLAILLLKFNYQLAATVCWENAKSLDPENPQSFLGSLLGSLSSAIPCIQSYLRLINGKDAAEQWNQYSGGTSLVNIMQDKAMDYLGRLRHIANHILSIQKRPHYLTHFVAAYSSFLSQEFVSCVAPIKVCCVKKPEDPFLWNLQAVIQTHLRNFPAAFSCFLKAQQLVENVAGEFQKGLKVTIQRNLARLSVLSGQFNTAISIYRSLDWQDRWDFVSCGMLFSVSDTSFAESLSFFEKIHDDLFRALSSEPAAFLQTWLLSKHLLSAKNLCRLRFFRLQQRLLFSPADETTSITCESIESEISEAMRSLENTKALLVQPSKESHKRMLDLLQTALASVFLSCVEQFSKSKLSDSQQEMQLMSLKRKLIGQTERIIQQLVLPLQPGELVIIAHFETLKTLLSFDQFVEEESQQSTADNQAESTKGKETEADEEADADLFRSTRRYFLCCIRSNPSPLVFEKPCYSTVLPTRSLDQLNANSWRSTIHHFAEFLLHFDPQSSSNLATIVPLLKQSILELKDSISGSVLTRQMRQSDFEIGGEVNFLHTDELSSQHLAFSFDLLTKCLLYLGRNHVHSPIQLVIEASRHCQRGLVLFPQEGERWLLLAICQFAKYALTLNQSDVQLCLNTLTSALAQLDHQILLLGQQQEGERKEGNGFSEFSLQEKIRAKLLALLLRTEASIRAKSDIVIRCLDAVKDWVSQNKLDKQTRQIADDLISSMELLITRKEQKCLADKPISAIYQLEQQLWNRDYAKVIMIGESLLSFSSSSISEADLALIYLKTAQACLQLPKKLKSGTQLASEAFLLLSSFNSSGSSLSVVGIELIKLLFQWQRSPTPKNISRKLLLLSSLSEKQAQVGSPTTSSLTTSSRLFKGPGQMGDEPRDKLLSVRNPVEFELVRREWSEFSCGSKLITYTSLADGQLVEIINLLLFEVHKLLNKLADAESDLLFILDHFPLSHRAYKSLSELADLAKNPSMSQRLLAKAMHLRPDECTVVSKLF